PLSSTPFPYTTLFRSQGTGSRLGNPSAAATVDGSGDLDLAKHGGESATIPVPVVGIQDDSASTRAVFQQAGRGCLDGQDAGENSDRKSTRLNSSHVSI